MSSTMSKEEFITNIKKWVVLDRQIKQLNEQIKQSRQMKCSITGDICNYMTHNSIQNKKIEINDGHLKFFEKKEYSPLTFAYVETCLSQVIKNPDQVEYIMKHIKENREVKTSVDIRRNNDVK